MTCIYNLQALHINMYIYIMYTVYVYNPQEKNQFSMIGISGGIHSLSTLSVCVFFAYFFAFFFQAGGCGAWCRLESPVLDRSIPTVVA